MGSVFCSDSVFSEMKCIKTGIRAKLEIENYFWHALSITVCLSVFLSVSVKEASIKIDLMYDTDQACPIFMILCYLLSTLFTLDVLPTQGRQKLFCLLWPWKERGQQIHNAKS